MTNLDRLLNPNDWKFDIEEQEWIYVKSDVDNNTSSSLTNKVKCIAMSAISAIAIILCITWSLCSIHEEPSIDIIGRDLMSSTPSDTTLVINDDEHIGFKLNYVTHKNKTYQHHIKLTSIPASMSSMIQKNEKQTTNLIYFPADGLFTVSNALSVRNYIESEFLKTGRLVKDCQRQNQEQKSCIITMNCETKHWDDWSCNFMAENKTVRTVHYWETWNLKDEATYSHQAWYPNASMYENLTPNKAENEGERRNVMKNLIDTKNQKVIDQNKPETQNGINKKSCVIEDSEKAPYRVCKSSIVTGAVTGTLGLVIGGILGIIAAICTFST